MGVWEGLGVMVFKLLHPKPYNVTMIQDLRKSYTVGELHRANLDADPIAQFEAWLQAALDAGVPEPTAMTLATVGEDGQPSARVVLLKGVDAQGFRFYSSYESRKGGELEHNPKVALVFYWHALERQVRIEGEAHKLSREASEVYFKSRPHGSQLGAWASQQSRVLESRAPLEARLKELEETYQEGEVPLPDFWGGYLVVPRVLEFWQGRPNRLHDRFRYTRRDDAWDIVRLSP